MPGSAILLVKPGFVGFSERSAVATAAIPSINLLALQQAGATQL